MATELTYKAYGRKFKTDDMGKANREFLDFIPECKEGVWWEDIDPYTNELTGYTWKEGNFFD